MPIGPSWRCCGHCRGILEAIRLPPAAPLLVPSPSPPRQAWLPLGWFLHRPCPLCRRSAGAAGASPSPCPECREQLGLEPGGLRGLHPLGWWAAGTYKGALRERILELRRRPDPAAAIALVAGMQPVLPEGNSRPLLVPIPSWKRQANPLPPLLTRVWSHRLGLRARDLLERAHPVLGQHHLGRELRFRNQEGAFRCRRGPRGDERRRRPLVLVDDILTTGATALSGAQCLEAADWRVLGILCLARTPQRGGKGRDLGSQGRAHDAPG